MRPSADDDKLVQPGVSASIRRPKFSKSASELVTPSPLEQLGQGLLADLIGLRFAAGRVVSDVKPNLQNIGDRYSIAFDSSAKDCLGVVRNSQVHVRFLAGIFERQPELTQGITIQAF